jgi:hypothetical protein
MILIAGATGANGTELIKRLSSAGAPIRAMARKPRKDSNSVPPGVEFVADDFDDPESLRKALNGVDRAFLVTNSSEKVEAQQLRFVELARAAGVQHIVYLSQLQAASNSPVRFLRYHGICRRRYPRVGHAIHKPASQPLHAESAAGIWPVDPVTATFFRACGRCTGERRRCPGHSRCRCRSLDPERPLRKDV